MQIEPHKAYIPCSVTEYRHGIWLVQTILFKSFEHVAQSYWHTWEKKSDEIIIT